MLCFVIVFRNCLVAFGSNAIYWSGKQTNNICKQCLYISILLNKASMELKKGRTFIIPFLRIWVQNWVFHSMNKHRWRETMYNRSHKFLAFFGRSAVVNLLVFFPFSFLWFLFILCNPFLWEIMKTKVGMNIGFVKSMIL